MTNGGRKQEINEKKHNIIAATTTKMRNLKLNRPPNNDNNDNYS